MEVLCASAPSAPEASILLIVAGMVLGMASWMVVPIMLIVAPPMVLAAMGQLSSTTLKVAGDQMYQQGLVRDIDLTDKIAWIRRDSSDNCYVLLDKQKKQLVRFSCNEPGRTDVLDYLTDHHIPWT